MITFTRGSIFDCGADILVNPVNCIGVMEKGLALEFKKRYPDMYKTYRTLCDEGLLEPGLLHIWLDNDSGKHIINFPTKDHWRNPSKYEYIENGLASLQSWLNRNGTDKKIAIPPLGCGNGGLDFDKVSRMIVGALETLRVNAYLYCPPGYEPNLSLVINKFE